METIMPTTEFGLGTHYKIDCIRNGDVVWTENINNMVVNEGLAYAMNAIFGGNEEGPEPLYMGLCSNSNSQPTDTMTSHMFVEYLGTTNMYRPTAIFSDGGITEDNMYNYVATDVQSMISVTDTLSGVFLTTGQTKGADAGILYGVAPFTSSPREVVSGDALLVTITVSAKG